MSATKGVLRTISVLHMLREGILVTRNEKKSDILNVFFASVFNSTSCPQAAQLHELKSREKNETPKEQGGNNQRSATPFRHTEVYRAG